MMTLTLRSLALGAILAIGTGAVSGPALAQNLFAPVATVNESVVTEFEVSQRQTMLEVFRAPDSSRETVIDDLIDERLQLDAAQSQGLVVTEQEIVDGMAEFAARANLETDQFVAEIGRAGVDVESFRDFVRAGVAWRKVVNTRFGEGQTQVDDAEVERAVDAAPAPQLRVLLNEIIIPANTPDRAARAESLVPRITSITSYAAFNAAAREYSATPSRSRGGQIDWLELANLPPQIQQLVRALQPGEVTPPIPLPNAIAFFQLREIDEIVTDRRPTSVDFAAYYIPGGQSQPALQTAAQVAGQVDTCDDLYGVAQGQDPSRLQRDSLPIGEVPGDVAVELAKLDPGEYSTALTRADGQTLVFLMLCDRDYSTAEEDAPGLDQVRRSLVQRRVGQKADNYLAELRANATVVIE